MTRSIAFIFLNLVSQDEEGGSCGGGGGMQTIAVAVQTLTPSFLSFIGVVSDRPCQYIVLNRQF